MEYYLLDYRYFPGNRGAGAERSSKEIPMKNVIRLLAAVTFFTVVMSLNSFGYSVLCHSLPTSVAVGATIEPLFTCAIPANAVAVGSSLRLTANLHPTNHSSNSYVVFNGNAALSGSALMTVEENWSITITNTGGTGVSFGGVFSNASAFVYVWGPQETDAVTVPWSSGWTLEIGVSSNGSVIVHGDTFTVEILD